MISMDFGKKIKELKEYGIQFNTQGDYSMASLELPEKWLANNYDSLMKEYSLYIKAQGNRLFFITEDTTNIEPIFNAIDEVISFNIELEKKAGLLKKKKDELCQLFVSEPLERLETLTFTFKDENLVKPQENGVVDDSVNKDTNTGEENTKANKENNIETINKTETKPKKRRKNSMVEFAVNEVI